MALTADIGTPQGTIRPIATPASDTNVFAGLNRVAGMFSDVMDEQTRAAARAQASQERALDNARQDRAEQRAIASEQRSIWDFDQRKGEAEAKDFAARLMWDHNSRTLENMQRPEQTIYGEPVEQITINGGTLGPEGEAATAKIEKVRKALVQGRVSQSVVDLQTRNIIDRYVGANPDKASEFAAALKDRGVDDPFVRSIEAARDAESFVKDQERAAIKSATDAAGAVGATVFSADGTIDVAATVRVGTTILRENDTFQRAKQKLELAEKTAGIDEKTRNAARQEFGDVAMSSAYKITDELSNSTVTSLVSLSNAIRTPDQFQKFVTESVPLARQSLQTAKSRIIQQMGPNVPSDVYQKTIDLIDKQLQAVDDLVAGDASVVKTRMEALKMFETSLGLSKAQSFPMWNYYSQIFGQANLVDAVSGGNISSIIPKEEMEALRQQLATGVQTRQGQQASLAASNFALLLGGTAKLEDLDPEQQRKAIPKLMASTAQHAQAIVNTGGGLVNYNAFVNSLAGTSNAVATSVQPSTVTLPSFINATKALTAGGSSGRPMVASAVLRLAQVPGYEDEARALANSVNISSMQLINGSGKLIQEASKGGIYNVTFNPRTTRYEVVTDQAKLQASIKNSRGLNTIVFGSAGQATGDSAPSGKEATALANTLNNLVGNMASMRELDPTFRGTKVSFEEAKTFFATGKTPESLKTAIKEEKSAAQKFEDASVAFNKAAQASSEINIEQRQEAVDRSKPRGIRNNNPGNIEFGTYARRQGATKGDGRFAIFDTPEEGFRAAENLVKSYGSRGINTIEKIVNRWAPPSENNTGAYINQVVRRTGLPKDTPLDLNNPDIVRKIVNAKIWVENGQNPYETSN